MNKIELFQKVKCDFEELKYDDLDKLDKLTRQLTMLIKNIHGSSSYYLDELMNISYISMSFNDSRDEDIAYWKSGKSSAINLIDTIIDELTIFAINDIPKENDVIKAPINRSKVFIVHGHDDGAVDKVARFVHKLGFEAIILREQSSSGDTVIEKIIRYSDVGFGIVLYTECDIGAVKSQPENLRSRARQNVVFEHGFLIGKIGKENVTALVKGDIEKPNDISGVVYISLDDSNGWQLSLVKEMIASGYNVDMNRFL